MLVPGARSKPNTFLDLPSAPALASRAQKDFHASLGREIGNPVSLNLAEFQRNRAKLKFAVVF
jgi:hypothetical protein